MTLALAPRELPLAGEHEWVGALIDLPALERRGWDGEARRFVPAAEDPLFGYALCPVRGCAHVTERALTGLCSRCQRRYDRWIGGRERATLAEFLAAVTQTPSEDLERMCLVCRTPGHQRPPHSDGLCTACLEASKQRGQSPAAYAQGDERYPPAAPRQTFGLCVLECDELACGSAGICRKHARHWRRAGRPRGAAFEHWAAQITRPLQAARFLDLDGFSDRLRAEILVGLTVSIERHRRVRVIQLREAIGVVRGAGVESLLELDCQALTRTPIRRFLGLAKDRLVLESADPDREFEKDVWDLRVFGKPQSYRLDFTAISQPWLRMLAKQWAREKAPRVHGACLKRMVLSLNALSTALARRADDGTDPGRCIATRSQRC